MKNNEWKPCMYSKTWFNQIVLKIILSLLLMGGLIIFSVHIAKTEKGFFPIVCIIATLTFGVAQLLYFTFYCILEGRQYKINGEGISVLYGGLIQRFYPWSAFQKIVVCDFAHATKFPSICYIIIRLAAFEEPYGPHSKQQSHMLSGIESWRGYDYTMHNFSRILFVEYSPAILENIMHLSKLPVIFMLTNYGKEKIELATMNEKNET